VSQAVAGGEERLVTMMDGCDPESFGAADVTCVRPVASPSSASWTSRIHKLSATGPPTSTVTWGTGRLQFSSKRMKTPVYAQITAAERYTIGVLRRHGCSSATIARVLGRHRSTIGREVRRNATRYDGGYRPQLADGYARSRRSRSRRNQRFSVADWALVHARLRENWSPEQVAGRFRNEHQLRISHETIYRHIWADKRAGGSLHTHLRGAPKRCRKRYGHYDSRGRLAGKRPITERPAIVAARGAGSAIGRPTRFSERPAMPTVC